MRGKSILVIVVLGNYVYYELEKKIGSIREEWASYKRNKLWEKWKIKWENSLESSRA